MKRWSLRRRRPRTGNADAKNSRPDASRTGAHRLSGAAIPQGYPPADSPALAQSHPGPRSPAGDYPRAAASAPLPESAPPPQLAPPPQADAAAYQLTGAWPEVCEQFSLRLLALAEQLRIPLDELEANEADPERLQRLYRIDHAATRMRSVSLGLRTLAGRADGELGGPATSLLDVIRMALSAIERYAQVSIAKITDLAVLGYVADDVAMLMAALLDNATRYSPGLVTVSAHLARDGCVLLRVEDTGIGMGPETVASINAALGGPVPEVEQRTGLRTGFPVVHRIARRHQIGVRLATRPAPASGTIAMVTLPVQLLCEIPDLVFGGPVPIAAPRAPAGGGTVTPGAAWGRPTATERPGPSRGPGWARSATEAERLPAGPAPAGGLPRRERASLRGESRRRGTRGGAGSEPPPALSAEAQAAARRTFADDITAFSQSSQELSRGSQEPAGEGTVP
jgi:Histidine kinase-, DNA gyrase B-, and HSP90-like ATPase